MTRHTEDDGDAGDSNETTEPTDGCGRGEPAPGVPEAGRDERPSVFVPDGGEVPEAEAGGRDDGPAADDRAATDGGV